MTREQANRRLLKILEEAVNKHPDWRFGQILFNYDYVSRLGGFDNIGKVIDPFHIESEEMLKNVEQARPE